MGDMEYQACFSMAHGKFMVVSAGADTPFLRVQSGPFKSMREAEAAAEKMNAIEATYEPVEGD